MIAAAILAISSPGGSAPSGAGGSAQGPTIGLAGMLIVFAGLVLLTLLLPRLRRLIERRQSKPAPQAVEAGIPDPTEEEVTAAVCAIHAHLSTLDQMENMHLTWGMYDKPYRPWRLTGRAELLLGRHSVQTRSRNRSS